MMTFRPTHPAPVLSFRTIPNSVERQREALTILLQRCFAVTNDGSLRRFLLFLPEGNRIVSALPGTAASMLATVDAAVDLLFQHGAINEHFWSALERERPGQQSIVRALRDQINCIPSPIPRPTPKKLGWAIGGLILVSLGLAISYGLTIQNPSTPKPTVVGDVGTTQTTHDSPGTGEQSMLDERQVANAVQGTQPPRREAEPSGTQEETQGQTEVETVPTPRPAEKVVTPTKKPAVVVDTPTTKPPEPPLKLSQAIQMIKQKCRRLAPRGSISIYLRYTVSPRGRVEQFKAAQIADSGSFGNVSDVTRENADLVQCAKKIFKRVVVPSGDSSREVDIRL